MIVLLKYSLLYPSIPLSFTPSLLEFPGRGRRCKHQNRRAVLGNPPFLLLFYLFESIVATKRVKEEAPVPIFRGTGASFLHLRARLQKADRLLLNLPV